MNREASAGSLDLGQLRFYASPPHECGYLPDRHARTVVADPEQASDNAVYGRLAPFGFRRSGGHVYLPHCDGCQACVPVRLDTARFKARRIQQRIEKRNADLGEHWMPARFDEAHFGLYERYVRSRHAGGSMAEHDADDYRDFVMSSWSDTWLMELREREQLLAVAVVDRFAGALSSVYTYFDPDASRRSLGVYAVLRTIARARALGLRWLYLGYWIAGCDKMEYKRDYVPQERLLHGQWVEWNG